MSDRPNFAVITPRLAVGNHHSCGQSGAHACIHIHRDDLPHYDCQFCWHSFGDLKIEYRDGEALTEENLQKIDAFIAGLAPDTKLLVHCMAGQARSPTIAAYALAMTTPDLHPIDAFALVDKAVWDQRGIIFNQCLTPKEKLVRRIEEYRKGMAK